MKMELHVPCRNRLDHLMSQCNFRGKKMACDAKTDEELFKSVKKCYIFLLDRYSHHLQEHFDVKCFDFKKQFTDYPEYMSGILQKRRFQSTPYVKRETNAPRNQTDECIWGNATVLEKVEKYLLETVPYYQFCDQCMGSENEITLQQQQQPNSEERQFKSVKLCYLALLDRYDHALLKHFDVRCFDFKKQFTDYTTYMSGILQKRRFQSTPYVKRDTNRPRNKANECIWENRAVLEKIDKYLLETVPYYQFCNDCMGSENEITATVAEYSNE